MSTGRQIEYSRGFMKFKDRLSRILSGKKSLEKITGSEIARRLGVEKSTVSSWRRGRTEPSINMIHKLAEALDVSPAELLGEKSPQYVDLSQWVTLPVIGKVPAGVALEVRQLQKACKALNIQYRRFHGCRHTFATKAANSGVGLPKVQAQLGHTNLATTQKYIRQNQMDDNEIRLVNFG
jgi:integrase